MNHSDPKAIVAKWRDYIDLAAIQNGFAVASGTTA